MNKTALENRLKVLESNLALLRQEREKLRATAEQQQAQELVFIGQITEVQMWLEDEPKQEEVTLPMFKTEAELEEALANRGKGPQGESLAALGGMRADVYAREAAEIVDWIDENNETP